MILTQSSSFSDGDVSKFAWSKLRSFAHVDTTAGRIMSLHSLGRKDKRNARTQAEHIRYCLIQAREYRDAYNSASLATKPTLLYYSLMSLALAQILFKGTGDDNLQRARGENAHHGLVFNFSPPQKELFDFRSVASTLRARPMMIGDRGKGTFELWQRLSREDPLVGPFTINSNSGSVVHKARVIFVSNDKRIGFLSEEGISLHECLASSPCMQEWFRDNSLASWIVRASASADISSSGQYTFVLAVHPHSIVGHIEKFKELIKMQADAYDRVDVHHLPDCFTLVCRHPIDQPFTMILPPGAMWSTNEVRFIDPKLGLNEFGLFYIGLFILGNLARYYPDKWIEEVERFTPLAAAVENFLESAEARIALLTLSDLAEKYYVMDH